MDLMQVCNCPPLDHLDRMTDSTGLIQHAIYSVPRRDSGYTTDDNARALRLCARLWQGDDRPQMLDRIVRYLSFLEHARCPQRGFHNFLSYQRDWLDTGGTGDCQGQAVLALAEVVGSQLPDGLRRLARELLLGTVPILAELRSLRAQAYVVQAYAHLQRDGSHQDSRLEPVALSAARRIRDCYHRSSRPRWPWFEVSMTYANAVLPQALFDAVGCWPDENFLPVADVTFRFLEFATRSNDIFWPVGNQDWYPQGEPKALYDQQPVEASTMAAAALSAWHVTHRPEFLQTFRRCHQWFLGANSEGQPLADVSDGSCFDALQAGGVNRNQGAESTLAWLWTETLHTGAGQEFGSSAHQDSPVEYFSEEANR
jgi:hypothetical protein